MKQLTFLVFALCAGCYLLFNDEQAIASLSYKVLDNKLSGFIEDFNNNKDSVKLVFIVGPSCGVCLRGLADFDQALFENYENNPKLDIFIIHVPTLGAKEKHVQAALSLMNGNNVVHYWDPSGQTGVAFQAALGIPVYAWDVWMLYEPNTQFNAEDQLAPPVFWQHQLRNLKEYNHQRLDAEQFVQQISRYIN